MLNVFAKQNRYLNVSTPVTMNAFLQRTLTHARICAEKD